MKKILVTGACGFIGSHLVEHLVKSGYSVKAFVFYNSFNSWGWLDKSPKEIRSAIEVFSGDIRDPSATRAASKGCDTIFHLAALIGIPYSYQAPDNYIDTNIRGTLNLLQAAREFGAKLIHTSTSEVYGTARFAPITEEHPLQGQSPYSASKIGADHLALSFFHSFQTPVTVIRPFNTYGPRQSARAIIPTVITQILNGENKIKVGSTYPTRDFSFVTDTAKGMIAAAKSEAAIGEVINLGTGYEIPIGELIHTIAALLGEKIEITTDNNRVRPANSEVERLLSANEKARKLLQWQPEFQGKAGLEKGLRETIQWFQQPENLTNYKFDQYNV